MKVFIDGLKLDIPANKLWRGNGMVSANNSSRLLLDYKIEHPKKYWEILNYLFGENGVGINHLKIEMGADVNSSSGTEPCIKRTIDENPDVTRGAGFILAKDAKKINPSLTLDMLYWGEPSWIQEDKREDKIYSNRYFWYKETLNAAYKTFDLKFDYVSATQNERAVDTDWIIYLSEHLKAEKDCEYDFSKIKIVASDEVCSWNIADRMLEDKRLLDAIDVIASHYTSWSTDNVKKLVNEYGKEAWFGEGSAPMNYAQGCYRFDGMHSGLDGLNGSLDIANRIVTMYSGGLMTLYEYQPTVASYYDGVNYCQKQLILANTPWNGEYLLDSGFFMSLHFSQFLKKGWAIVKDASFADGVVGGDGHAIINTNYSYLTGMNPETKDFSTVIVNTKRTETVYDFSLSNVKKNMQISVYETRGPDSENDIEYDRNYFKKVETISPVYKDEVASFSVTIKPCSIVTVTSLIIEEVNYPRQIKTNGLLKSELTDKLLLPYKDDFEYSDYSENYLVERGNAPRYTTDASGAFEVVKEDEQEQNNVVMQMITTKIKGIEWASSSEPMTTFGDDSWYNYLISVNVKLAQQISLPDNQLNYIGVGGRCNLSCSGQSGYWIKLLETGDYILYKNAVEITKGKLDNFDNSKWQTIELSFKDNYIQAFINKEKIIDCKIVYSSVVSSGRVALYSAYENNCFDNVNIQPLENSYVTHYDQTDFGITYSGKWNHNLMSSFRDYKRTISTGQKDASFSFDFYGTGFLLTGTNAQKPLLKTIVDGKVILDNFLVLETEAREVACSVTGLQNAKHSAEVIVLSNEFSCDGLQIVSE